MDTDELIVDSFAGGGGASLGISQALGRCPDVAINHDPAAIEMHRANHPATRHYTEDVWKVAPRKVTGGRPVGLLWASPDCKHFSRAKGSKPVEKSIRSLAWVVARWAEQCAPRVVILENVREFEEWGPLVPRWECRSCRWRGTEGQATLARRGRRACPRCESRQLAESRCDRTGKPVLVPDPARKGLTFRRFVGRLRNLGYAVEWRTLNAADYGAPTHRRRLFLIARNDGEPIVWPEPTHADPKKIAAAAGSLFPLDLAAWRTAAECIDWSVPCPSIFTRKKPLVEKTLRRIALGVKRYVLDNPRPFLVRYNSETSDGDTRSHDLADPLPTAPTQNRFGLVVPVLADMQRENRGRGVDEPLGTVTTQGNRFNVVAPVVVRTDMHKSNAGCAYGPGEPLRTVTSGGGFGVVSPVVVPVTHAGERRGHGPEEPLPTVTGANRGELAFVAPTLVQTGYGERDGQAPRTLDLGKPMGTVVGGACKQALVAAFLAKHFGGVVGVPADTPLPTTTARGTQNQVVAANLVRFNHDDAGVPVDGPMPTQTTSNHAALVYSFLTKYFGTGGQWACPADPLPTATGKARFGLVTVDVDGQTYVVVDIGMRMLKPRELARGQGFPDSYLLTGTATSQVERVGNSVCPQLAKVLVEANYTPRSAAVCA